MVLSSSPVPVARDLQHRGILDAITWLSETDDEPSPPSKRHKPGHTPAILDPDSVVDSNSMSLKSGVNSLPPRDSVSDPIAAPSSPIKSSSRPQTVSYTAKQLREANKVTRKKPDLLGEMVVEISALVADGFLSDEDTAQHLQPLEVRRVEAQWPTIAWKRKIQASYDPQRDLFIPCAATETRERILVLYYAAADAVDRMKTKLLDADVHQVVQDARKDNPGDYHVIVVMDGYDQYVAKIRNDENRRYKARVLGQPSLGALAVPLGTETTAKDVEMVVQQTQIRLGVNIFPVRNGREALGWLGSLTYTIAGRIYDKYERTALGTLGTVKSGTDTRSTFVQSIRQMRLMTEPKAERLAEFYPGMARICEQLNSRGNLGQDCNGKNIVPPLVHAAMKVFFGSMDPNEVVYEG